MKKNGIIKSRNIFIMLLFATMFTASISISLAEDGSPPSLPNTFSGTVKFANSIGQFDVPAGTVIEALIENVSKGSSAVIEAGKYRIDVSGTYDDDGKNITFIINNVTAEQRAVFNVNYPPPMTLNLIVNLPEHAYVNVTNISSCTTITMPGVYLLNTSIINCTATTCINITSSNVVFDGSGHTIDGIDAVNTYGVYVYNFSIALTNVTVKNLKATDWAYGIYYNNVANGIITNNTASSNSINGIYLVYSNSNLITNNNISNNNGTGLFLPSSSYNVITSNNASNNNDAGIFIGVNSSNNTATGNAIRSNSIGIELYSSSNNSVYNNFFNNTNNVISNNSTNTWNTTKTPGTNIIGGSYLGGNLWAYPNGTGFSQTCTDADSDGICDTPYVLDANNIDYLPLAYRANITTLSAPKPKVPRKPIAGKLEVIIIPENPTIYDNVSMEVKLTYPTAGYKVKFGNASIKNNTITVNVDSEEPKGMAVQVITTYSKKYNIGQLSEGAYACEVYINGVLSGTYRFGVSITVQQPPPPSGGGGGGGGI